MVFLKSDCKRMPYRHLALAMFARLTSFGIRCGFLRQLRALRVRAAFEQVFVWFASYNYDLPDGVALQ